MEFKYIEFIKEIVKFSPRTLENEQKTAKFLVDFLRNNQIKFEVQEFETSSPDYLKAELTVDDKKIDCLGTGFVSGKIVDKNILDSRDGSNDHIVEPNINFTPDSEFISCPNHYFAPSLAVSKNDLSKIQKGKNFLGELIVGEKIYISSNILVGNTKNPKKIIFCHYDSVETGAMDNASGVAVMMKMVLTEKNILNDNLFVFAGNEELSYDFPIYWGRGYRIFEEENFEILDRAKKILVIDGVGFSKTFPITDLSIVKLAFPIENMKNFKDKIITYSGDLEEMMTFYHTREDTVDRLSSEYLEDAYKLVLKEINLN